MLIQFQIYNSLERKIVPFTPNNHQLVKIYACGPTVYDYAHIGNLRTYINEDLLIRTLKFNGYKIKHVINITDVGHLTNDVDSGDDKMELSAVKEETTIWNIAQKYTDAFMSDFQKLNICQPTLWSKATDHILEQIELIKRLEEINLTYLIENDGIYYDTSKFKDYGKLGGQNLDELKAGARINFSDAKKNINDFALWKFSPKDKKRLMEWNSPWGIGFPGWHIECSAMALKYLGEEIDIHCGGVDHIKVHHSNEIAQVEPLTKKKWVRYWMHSEFLNEKDSKMSKSDGDFLTLSFLEKKGYLPMVFRFYCLSSHYRSKLNFSFESLDAAQQGYLGLMSKLKKMNLEFNESSVDNEKLNMIKNEIKKSINNDLNSSETLAYLFKLLKESSINSSTKISSLAFFDEILGLDFLNSLQKKELEENIPREIQLLLIERTKAKNDKNYNDADRIRDKIKELGFLIEDSNEGLKLRRF